MTYQPFHDSKPTTAHRPHDVKLWKSRILKWLRVMLCLLSVIAVAMWVYLRWGDIDPRITIPLQVLPKANAHHTWEKAWAAARELNAVADIVIERRKAAQMPTAIEAREWSRLLELNKSSLQLVSQGLTVTYARPRLSSYSELMPDVGHCRSLARLLVLKAEAQIASGEPDLALATALDTMHMGQMMFSSSPIICRLVGVAIESMGRGTMERIVDRVGPEAAKAAAVRMWEMDMERAPLSSTLRQDMHGVQSMLVSLYRKRDWRLGLMDITYFSGDMKPDMFGRFVANVVLCGTTKRGLLAEYTRKVERQIGLADRLPPLRLDYDTHLLDIAETLTPQYNNLVHLDASRSLVHARLLMLDVALRAFFLEKLTYPATLEEIVPRYLKTLPRDPYAPHQTYRYVRKGTDRLLYSIGPDLIDQGGESIKLVKTEPSTKRVIIQWDSVGDIVAGVQYH